MADLKCKCTPTDVEGVLKLSKDCKRHGRYAGHADFMITQEKMTPELLAAMGEAQKVEYLVTGKVAVSESHGPFIGDKTVRDIVGDTCGAEREPGGLECRRPKGHVGTHASAYERWPNEREQHAHPDPQDMPPKRRAALWGPCVYCGNLFLKGQRCPSPKVAGGAVCSPPDGQTEALPHDDVARTPYAPVDVTKSLDQFLERCRSRKDPEIDSLCDLVEGLKQERSAVEREIEDKVSYKARWELMQRAVDQHPLLRELMKQIEEMGVVSSTLLVDLSRRMTAEKEEAPTNHGDYIHWDSKIWWGEKAMQAAREEQIEMPTPEQQQCKARKELQATDAGDGSQCLLRGGHDGEHIWFAGRSPEELLAEAVVETGFNQTRETLRKAQEAEWGKDGLRPVKVKPECKLPVSHCNRPLGHEGRCVRETVNEIREALRERAEQPEDYPPCGHEDRGPAYCEHCAWDRYQEHSADCPKCAKPGNADYIKRVGRCEQCDTGKAPEQWEHGCMDIPGGDGHCIYSDALHCPKRRDVSAKKAVLKEPETGDDGSGLRGWGKDLVEIAEKAAYVMKADGREWWAELRRRLEARTSPLNVHAAPVDAVSLLMNSIEDGIASQVEGAEENAHSKSAKKSSVATAVPAKPPSPEKTESQFDKIREALHGAIDVGIEAAKSRGAQERDLEWAAHMKYHTVSPAGCVGCCWLADGGSGKPEDTK